MVGSQALWPAASCLWASGRKAAVLRMEAERLPGRDRYALQKHTFFQPGPTDTCDSAAIQSPVCCRLQAKPLIPAPSACISDPY